MSDESLYLMSPIEIAFGYLFGHAGTLPPPRIVTTPRLALESVVREALLRPPCGVAFSGGRDSSLVLAVAAYVARRDGLQEPIPITRVFPDVPQADESEWQEMVMRHLGLSDWHRPAIHDEMDLIGPLAQRHLLEHGVIWPPTVHGDIPLMEPLGGGSLMDGEGGDEVLGVEAHRVAPVTTLVRAPRLLRWRRLRTAIGAVAPAPIVARYKRRRPADVPVTWLRPAAHSALLAEINEANWNKPLSFSSSVRMVPRRRTQLFLAQNRRALARAHGVDVSSPLLHPDVVHAIARDGGVLGRGDRTAALRALAPDLLPDAVLTRTSKAVFNEAFMARHTREFAQRWSGGGVDPELVDPDELRRWWLSDTGNALSSALLQSVWLNEHGA